MTAHPVDQRLAQIKSPPGLIVAMADRDDVSVPFVFDPRYGTVRLPDVRIAEYVLALLCPGESCDVYAATYQYDVANDRHVWRRGALLGTLSKEPLGRRYKRRQVR